MYMYKTNLKKKNCQWLCSELNQSLCCFCFCLFSLPACNFCYCCLLHLFYFSGSNLSQISSQWSQGSSQTWFDSTDDMDKTMLVSPPSPPPNQPSADEQPSDDSATQNASASCSSTADFSQTPSGVKQPAKPRSEWSLNGQQGCDSSEFNLISDFSCSSQNPILQTFNALKSTSF